MFNAGRFEKVSLPRFTSDVKATYGDKYSDEEIKDAWEKLKLPRRATSGSAGYDFFTPFPISLSPHENIKIPTGIRVKIDPGWWLACLPRSGLGFKYRIQLDNTVGVIDEDYYHSDNEGHIFIKCTYDSDGPYSIDFTGGDLFDNVIGRSDSLLEAHRKNILHINQDGAFMQAIFLPYGITHGDDTTDKRNGGFGSTDKGGKE